ncbi:aldo/keto reductase [Cupriavidus basilensis]
MNFIDTADVYSKGASEQMVGRLLVGDRHDWVLATKLGNPMQPGPNRSHYLRACGSCAKQRKPAPTRHRLSRYPLPAPRLRR